MSVAAWIFILEGIIGVMLMMMYASLVLKAKDVQDWTKIHADSERILAEAKEALKLADERRDESLEILDRAQKIAAGFLAHRNSPGGQ